MGQLELTCLAGVSENDTVTLENNLVFLIFFFNVYFSERQRDRESASRGGAEKKGDTESEAGFRL